MPVPPPVSSGPLLSSTTPDTVSVPSTVTVVDSIPLSPSIVSSASTSAVTTSVTGTTPSTGGVPGVSTAAGATPGVPEPGSSGSSTGDVMETVTRPLKAQADVMAAQAKAVAVQNLPSLSCYTGEGSDAIDDGFDRWM